MPGFTSTKRFKVLVVTATILLVILMVGYYMIISNAESLVQRLVAYESKGKFKVTVGKIRFHPFQRRIDLINISLQSDHVANDETTFSFAGEKVTLQLSHIRPLIFRKQLLVDSILFESPRLKIIQQQVQKGWGTNSTRKTSLHEILGNVYVKMQNLFQVLYVKRGEVNNAELTLADNNDPAHPTLTLKGMFFLLERLDVDKKKSNERNEFMFSRNITFRTGPESIDLPDGLHHLSFSQLTLNTSKKFIEISDCHIQGVSKANSKNRYDIFNKTLKLVNLDFAALYARNIIQADSVYCLNPNLSMELGHNTNTNLQPKKREYSYDSLQQIIKLVTGNLNVHYLGIVNADINTFVEIKNKVNTFSTHHASFEIYDLNVNTASGMPATVDRIDFALRGYTGYMPDSLYILKFDSIRLLSHRLILWNAALSPGPKVTRNNFKDLHVGKFELTDIDWLDFLKNKRVTAKRAMLTGADVKIFVERNKKTRVQGNIIDALHTVNPALNVEDLVISNATIDYKVKDRLSLTLQNANVEVSVHDFIKSDSIDHLHRSLLHLIADNGEFKTKKITAKLSGISYFRRDSLLTIQKIRFRHEKGIVADADNLFVKAFQKTGGQILVGGIGWKKAIVNVRMSNNVSSKKEEPHRKMSFEIGNIDLGKTDFSFEKDDQKMTAAINYIQGKSISPGKEISLGDLHISGNHISYENKKQKLKIGAFQLNHNAASLLRGVHFEHAQPGTEMLLSFAEIKCNPDIRQVLEKKYVVKDIVLESPEIKYVKRNISTEGEAKKTSSDIPVVDINSLTMVRPSILMDNDGDKKTHLDIHGEELKINDIKSGHGRLDAGSITAKLKSIQYKNGSGTKLESGTDSKMEMVVDAAHYKIGGDDAESRWQALIGKIVVSNLLYEKMRNDSLQLLTNIHSFALSDFLAKEKSMKSFESIVRDNPNVEIHHATAAINTKKTNFYFRNLRYHNKNLSLDSLSALPVLTWEEFNEQSSFQRDYIKVRTGNVDAKGFDLLRYAAEKKLVIENLTVDRPVLNVSKDKRLIFQTGIIKPLPAHMMMKINFPVLIDTTNIKRGYVSYTETSEKTLKTGVISFNNLNAWIHPLKNFDIYPTDSLRLRAEASMMDSMNVSLRIRESYTDSLAGFWMTVGIKPTEIPILNPVLEPLASVQVGSGKLDHLEMRAVGREYISFGEMKFFYHDLKVKILKNGELEKKSFLTSLATFVANKFVIRTNNTSREGRVFFIRNRERSIFNYWLKMTLSGVASSAGAKNNRKMMRQYKEQIKKKQLPPIDFE
ncbi:MAG: hypothetical protein JST75_10880 [Bacteroidetes bacterium]|nr:hypothetical protein [Bacteroidota bacterium]